MAYSCLDLIPQQAYSLVRNHKMQIQLVRLVHDLVGLLIEALELFYLKNQYDLFDPHVGETACQIRACYFLDLASLGDLKTINHRIEALNKIKLNLLSVHQWVVNQQIEIANNQLSIQDFFIKISCHFSLTQHEIFLVKSYFLTVFKYQISSTETYIDYADIASTLLVSRKFSKKLVHYYQVSIARYSCQYIMDICSESEAKDVISSCYQCDDDGRSVLPCYLFSKILFDHLLKSQALILIQIKRTGLNSDGIILNYDIEVKKLSLLESNNQIFQLSKNRLCFYIKAETRYDFFEKPLQRYITQLNQLGFREIFLSYMAAHPQYSGSRLSHLSVNPFVVQSESGQPVFEVLAKELNHYQIKAKQIGVCAENDALLFIKHICCDKMDQILPGLSNKIAEKSVSSVY